MANNKDFNDTIRRDIFNTKIPSNVTLTHETKFMLAIMSEYTRKQLFIDPLDTSTIIRKLIVNKFNGFFDSLSLPEQEEITRQAGQYANGK